MYDLARFCLTKPWKNLVFRSPSATQRTAAFCFQKSSSIRSRSWYSAWQRLCGIGLYGIGLCGVGAGVGADVEQVVGVCRLGGGVRNLLASGGLNVDCRLGGSGSGDWPVNFVGRLNDGDSWDSDGGDGCLLGMFCLCVNGLGRGCP
ncbi:coenzyme PQQ synthesis protein E [Striga asiatica]|uniref:Coenzyme PQQ synthesis protein E n=1 Tax=Striga asiatica TaxID=4170 RepID=A0A5A7PKL3_STRAF|nr:coenzyme PQQ synthesis protein E [Striga asiatica]